MTSRTMAVIAMTEEEARAMLARLGVLHPDVFDELMADTERQREIRRERERGDGGEEGEHHG